MVIEDIFKALGDPTRLRIARLLGTMELAVGELAQVLGQSQPRVSRHVGILCDAGLAERRREGSWVFLRQSESSAPVIEAVQRLLALAERAWSPATWAPPYGAGATYEWGDKRVDAVKLKAGWQDFAGRVAAQLPMLDKMGIAYRVAPPGARIVDGRLEANTVFPGTAIEYRVVGGDWKRYSGPVGVSGEIELRSNEWVEGHGDGACQGHANGCQCHADPAEGGHMFAQHRPCKEGRQRGHKVEQRRDAADSPRTDHGQKEGHGEDRIAQNQIGKDPDKLPVPVDL